MSTDHILFNAAHGIGVALLPDTPVFTVAAVTDDFVRSTGIIRERAIGKSFFDLFKWDNGKATVNRDHLKMSLNSVVRQRGMGQLKEGLYEVFDGEVTRELWWNFRYRTVLAPSCDLRFIVLTAEEGNRSDQQKSELAKIRSIDQACDLLLQVPAVIQIVKGEKNFLLLANSEAFKLWNSTDDIIGRPLLDAIPELRDQKLLELIDEVRATSRPQVAKEVPVSITAHGKQTLRFFDIVLQPYFVNSDKTADGVFTLLHEVTQFVEIRSRAEEKEDHLQSALQAAWLGTWDYYPVSGEMVASAIFKRIFGLKPEDEFTYEFFLNNVIEEDRARVRQVNEDILNVKEGQAKYDLDFRIKRADDGHIRWVRAIGKAYVSSEGLVDRFTGTMMDVTDQRAAMEALKKSESELRNLVLQAPVAMSIGRGPSFIVEVANDRMLQIWGRSAAEIIGHPVFDVLPEAGNQGLKEIIEKVFQTGERFTAQEMPVTLPRGEGADTLYLNFVYEPIRNLDGSISKIVAVATDVTAQVVARKKIEENHREFQFAMDFIPQMLWLTRPDGYHYYYNKKWYDYTGLTYGETRGDGWNNVFHPDDQDRAWKQWNRSLETGMPYEIEYRCRRFDGGYRWFLGRALPMKDDDGAIIKWFGTCTDIHDQKTFVDVLENEVKERTRQVRQSNEDLQQFVHVASHDLREPVRKISVFAGRIMGDSGTSLSERSKFFMNRIAAATARMGDMLDGVLTYSTIGKLDEIYELVDLNKVLKSVEEDLELVIQQRNAVIRKEKLPELEAVPEMMHQLLYNLLGNSLKFIKTDSTPVIKFLSETVRRNGRKFVHIIVEDNGIGFDQEYSEKIFGTFIRLHTKDDYEGAGLGLSLCKKIVERHGGIISAEGAENKGSRIDILLPVSRPLTKPKKSERDLS